METFHIIVLSIFIGSDWNTIFQNSGHAKGTETLQLWLTASLRCVQLLKWIWSSGSFPVTGISLPCGTGWAGGVLRMTWLWWWLWHRGGQQWSLNLIRKGDLVGEWAKKGRRIDGHELGHQRSRHPRQDRPARKSKFRQLFLVSNDNGFTLMSLLFITYQR